MNPPLLSLKIVGLLIGLVWTAAHTLMMLRPADTRGWLQKFPRSRMAGLVLLTVDFLWTYALAYTMDWGEFYYLQTPVMFALPVFFYLVIRYVDDFLSVRALGILGLLAAAPVFDAAFLRPQMSRLLVVALAYAWVLMGFVYVSMPHVLRDQIGWLNQSTARRRAAAGAGVADGGGGVVWAVGGY